MSNTTDNRHVMEMMRWHFSKETGTPFWLDVAEDLPFDPLTEIRSVDDLLRFPNVVDRLRDVPLSELTPAGLDPAVVPLAVYESGGTTGTPKRFLMYEEWFAQYMAWEDSHYPDDPRGNALAVVPSGPHMIGEYTRRIALARGGVRFSVDLDPRWVRRLIERGDTALAAEYVAHVVDQARLVLASQDVPILITTPPLLLRLLDDPGTVEMIRQKVRLIIWSGAHIDLDTLEYLEQSVLPGIVLRGSYGSTTVLSGTVERPVRTDDGHPVYDSYAPYVIYRVVDPQTHELVDYGAEGLVVMNYLTRFGLTVNSVERDLAIRLPSATGVGDALAAIRPVTEAGGKQVIEGVY